MIRRIRPGLTYANVIATLALFFALGGGAYAALQIPSNSVGTKQIKDRAVTLGKISGKARHALHGQNGTNGRDGTNGTNGTNGAPGAPGISNAYHLTRSTAVNPLPHAATTVATLTGLAPGSYLITGHAAAVNFGANDYVRCSIFANGTAYGGSTVFVGGNAGATTVADLTTIAPPSSSTTFDASLQCSHDNSPDGPYVESITLSAIQVNHLDARTSASTN